MGEYQIWVLVVVVVLSILDAVVKKAKKRGLGLPEGDEPSGAGEVEQERPRPVPGPDGAQRFPGPVAAPGPETARPGPRDLTRRGPQPRPQPSTTAPRSAGKRQSAFDILVPPEIRKELEDLVSGGKAETGRRPPSPTRASGPGEPSGSSAPPDPGSLPLPSEASASPTLGFPGDGGYQPGESPVSDRAHGPRPVEVRSRSPRPLEARAKASRREHRPTAPATAHTPRPATGPRTGIASQLGFGTTAGLRRVVVAREILGAPVALREDGRGTHPGGANPPAAPLAPGPPDTTCEETDSSPAAEVTAGPRSTSAPSAGDSASRPNATKRPRPPINAPGKRPGKLPPPPPQTPRPPHVRRPELRCREVRPSRWEVGVALPDNSDRPKMLHDGNQLTPSGDFCPLDDLGGRITTGDGRDTLLAVALPLIFKTSKSWKGVGRRVGRVTAGYFLVIVPASWKRNDPPPVDPADVTVPGYRAHYVYSNGRDTDPVVFAGHDPLPTANARDILEGSTVFDDSDKGLLYTGECPELKSPGDFEWVVVGEEGNPQGWRCRFEPHQRRMRDVMGGREGWFFVRLYDANGDLLVSTDFRYAERLAQIQLNNFPYSENTILLPEPTGHAPAHLTLVDVSGELILKLVLPQNKEADGVRVTPGGVPIEVSLPRLWWRRLDNEDHGPWCDSPFRWTIDEFNTRAANGTKIRVSAPSSVSAVICGFHHDDRRYNRVGKYIDIPLDEFLDSDALDPELRDRRPLSISCRNLFSDVPLVHLLDGMGGHAEQRQDDAPEDHSREEGHPFTFRGDCADFLIRHYQKDSLPSWKEAISDDFIALKPMSTPLPEPKSWVWAYLASKGYVGVGIVKETEQNPGGNPDGTTRIPVQWRDTVSDGDAYEAKGLMIPANVVPVCGGEWGRMTIDALKLRFKKWDSHA